MSAHEAVGYVTKVRVVIALPNFNEVEQFLHARIPRLPANTSLHEDAISLGEEMAKCNQDSAQ
jgi:hypothetical protein